MSLGFLHVNCVLQARTLPAPCVASIHRVQEYRRVYHVLQEATAVKLVVYHVRYVVQPTTRLLSDRRLAMRVLQDRTRMVVGKLAVLCVQLGCIHPPVL